MFMSCCYALENAIFFNIKKTLYDIDCPRYFIILLQSELRIESIHFLSYTLYI